MRSMLRTAIFINKKDDKKEHTTSRKKPTAIESVQINKGLRKRPKLFSDYTDEAYIFSDKDLEEFKKYDSEILEEED